MFLFKMLEFLLEIVCDEQLNGYLGLISKKYKILETIATLSLCFCLHSRIASSFSKILVENPEKCGMSLWNSNKHGMSNGAPAYLLSSYEGLTTTVRVSTENHTKYRFSSDFLRKFSIVQHERHEFCRKLVNRKFLLYSLLFLTCCLGASWSGGRRSNGGRTRHGVTFHLESHEILFHASESLDCVDEAAGETALGPSWIE